jgi:hypothetical protein
MGIWWQSFPCHVRWMGVNKTTRKVETSQHSREDYDNNCVLLENMVVIVCY